MFISVYIKIYIFIYIHTEVKVSKTLSWLNLEKSKSNLKHERGRDYFVNQSFLHNLVLTFIKVLLFPKHNYRLDAKCSTSHTKKKMTNINRTAIMFLLQ